MVLGLSSFLNLSLVITYHYIQLYVTTPSILDIRKGNVEH